MRVARKFDRIYWDTKLNEFKQRLDLLTDFGLLEFLHVGKYKQYKAAVLEYTIDMSVLKAYRNLLTREVCRLSDKCRKKQKELNPKRSNKLSNLISRNRGWVGEEIECEEKLIKKIDWSKQPIDKARPINWGELIAEWNKIADYLLEKNLTLAINRKKKKANSTIKADREIKDDFLSCCPHCIVNPTCCKYIEKVSKLCQGLKPLEVVGQHLKNVYSCKCTYESTQEHALVDGKKLQGQKHTRILSIDEPKPRHPLKPIRRPTVLNKNPNYVRDSDDDTTEDDYDEDELTFQEKVQIYRARNPYPYQSSASHRQISD